MAAQPIRDEMLTVNELFSGIGSQSAALERLGIDFKVIGIAEIDKYSINSYEAIHGQARNYGDISKIDKLDYADFWTYSFPCQDISVAGLQRGINENTRSGLLYQVERLLEKARDHEELPKYLMLENVKNLVGKQFKPQFDEWLQKLDQLGYNTYWKVLNAKNYGIPQNRERVFAISIRKDIDMGYEFPAAFDNGKRLKDILETKVDEKFYIDNEKVNRLIFNNKNGRESAVKQVGNIVHTGNFENPQRGRIYSADGCSPALNCCGGGGLEPKILQVGNTNPSGHGMNGNVFHQDGLSPTLTTNKGEGMKIIEIGKLNENRHSSAQNSVLDTAGICTTIDTIQGENRQPKVLIETNIELPCIAASRGRNLENPSDRTPGNTTEQRIEVNTKGTSNTITTVQKDNYVIEPINEIIKEFDIPRDALNDNERQRRVYNPTGISPTVLARVDSNKIFQLGTINGHQSGHIYSTEGVSVNLCANGGGMGAKTGLYNENFRIRKLTPLECWRLMGFEDEQFYKAAEVNSNSQLYKQAGNSIVVDVLYYIFKNLFIDAPTEKKIDDSITKNQITLNEYLGG